mgnify:CR=1 FL=1
MIVLKATQDKVLAVLQSVAGIVERRHTLPILANVLIRKTGNALQLTTSDLEIQIRTTAELGGDTGDFTTTVGARKLIDILRTMPGDQTVSLESQQSKLVLKGDLARFPFLDPKDGQFLVTARINGATLEYASGWPRIDDIQGSLRFEGARMLIEARSAKLLGARLSGVKAEIADLEAPEELLSITSGEGYRASSR